MKKNFTRIDKVLVHVFIHKCLLSMKLINKQQRKQQKGRSYKTDANWWSN